MDYSNVIAFPRPNNWTSKRHYKAFDFTVNQCLISSVAFLKNMIVKLKVFVDSLALVQSYQEQFKQLTALHNSADLESYVFCEIPSFSVPAIVRFARFLALVHAINSTIS